jgi:uncharacterized protein (DUF58 family)
VHEEEDPGLADVLVEVRRIEVQSRRLATDVMGGGYRSVFRGAGIEVDSVREYDPGDDPRRIDWNVTARMGRPFVKTYVDERDVTVLFLLDISPSMGGGWGARTARDTAARAVACLGISAQRAGDRIGLVAFSRGVDAFVAPRRGPAHALRIVRDSLVLRGESGEGGLAAALGQATRGVRRHAVVFVVSDFLASGWERALSIAARRHDVVAVRIVLPESDLPRGGLIRVVDPEGGSPRVLDLDHRGTRAAWAARIAAWSARTEAAFERAGVDRMDVRVPRTAGRDHVARALLAFFRMRELRGAKK